MENTLYWKDLVSTALRLCQEQGDGDAVSVIKNGSFSLEFNAHDNWNGGINYWDIVFQMKYRDYVALGDRKDSVEATLLSAIEQLHVDGSNRIANVIIRPLIERFLDWNAILPATRDTTIQMI